MSKPGDSSNFFDPDAMAESAKDFLKNSVKDSLSGVTDTINKFKPVLGADGKAKTEEVESSLMSMISGFFDKFSFGKIFEQISGLFQGLFGGKKDDAPTTTDNTVTTPGADKTTANQQKSADLPSVQTNLPNLKDKANTVAK